MAKLNAPHRARFPISTGPRTAAGKARASRNAWQHGLSLPVMSDPELAVEIQALVQKIAGVDAPADRQGFATAIAIAQIELIRVRQVRHQMLSLALNDPDYIKPTIALLRRQWLTRHTSTPRSTEVRARAETDGVRDPGKFATTLADLSVRLLALDRYERRALSRRKRAIRAFDAFCASAEAKGTCRVGHRV